MNVLADRHHAGLYRSLHLLAERMGWTLYTPIGDDWFTEGYWQFGAAHLGRALVDQYLMPHDGVWTPIAWDGTERLGYVTRDSEFPDVSIYGVTLAAARDMEWSFICATVQDNQYGFHRFAQEVGAQYVYQVGNTGQQIDWNLDPLALVSSEVPIHGRGVRMHQEMDPAASYFRDPRNVDRASMVSAVNCFPQIRHDHPYIGEAWEGARSALVEFTFWEHGIDGADGIVKPLARLASLFAAGGFVWHDKPQGDGFGHVIHMAAAIGRPLIGHASHYRGKMAEVFWTPETSIDLDRYSVTEAVDLIRAIAADPARHAAMCRNIRALYDEIDYDAEAEAIRELLTAQGAVAEMSMA